MNRYYRVSGIFLVLLLSIIAFFQEQTEITSLDGRSVTLRDIAPANPKERPFYFEDFVTKGTPGNICHVSSITALSDGRMACVWYQGSRESGRDVSIYFSVFDEKTFRWTRPIVLLTPEQSSRELGRYVRKLGNPLIFSDTKGSLWLIYASVAAGGWSGASLNYKVSADLGRSWSRSRKLVLSPFFNLTQNVKNKGIELDDGSFLIPVYQEFIGNFSELVRLVPGDRGMTCAIWKIDDQKNAIQPSLLPVADSNISAFFRNTGSERKKRILTATSSDLGRTWSGTTETALPNANAGFDMVSMDNGDYLAVINDSFYSRTDLTLVISADKGKTWKRLKVLTGRRDAPEEYAEYPSVDRSSSGLYHLTYTYGKRQVIRHVVFNEAWIRQVSAR